MADKLFLTNWPECRTLLVKWNGSGLRVLKDNAAAAAVWRDPKSGETWVYAQKSATDTNKPRCPVPPGGSRTRGGCLEFARPSKRFPAISSFRGMAPARFGGFSRPQCGIALLPDISWKKRTNGCWPSIAPDNSYLSWTFDGSHRDLCIRSWTTGQIVDGPAVERPGASMTTRSITPGGPTM